MVVEGDAIPSEEEGYTNHSSRGDSKRPAERQPCRADIDGEAEDHERKWKAAMHVGVVAGAGTSCGFSFSLPQGI
ncbi:hypothetical protein ACQJBY_022050 [Aegilops geniculata]